MAKALSLSLDEYPNLGGLLHGQKVTLQISGSVLDATDRTVTIGVTSIGVTKKSKMSTQQIMQELSAIRLKMPAAEARP